MRRDEEKAAAGMLRRSRAEEQKKKAAEAEKAYHSALDRIPDQKFDPWGNMR